MIYWKLTKIQLRKVAEFYSRLFGGEQVRAPSIQHTNFLKISGLFAAYSRFWRITCNLGKFANFKALFPAVLIDIR